MISALVDKATHVIANKIMADPAIDRAPDGFDLVAIPDGSLADIGWTWTEADGFMPPTNEAA